MKTKTAHKGASQAKVEIIRYSPEKAVCDKTRTEVVSELCLTNKNWRKALSNFTMTTMLTGECVRRSDAFTACIKVYSRHTKDGIGFASAPGEANMTFYVCDRENAKLGKPASPAKIAALKSYMMSLSNKISSRFYADDCAVERPLLEKLGFAEVFRAKDKNGRENVIMGIGYAPITKKESAKAKKARIAAEAKVAEDAKIAAEAAAKKAAKKTTKK